MINHSDHCYAFWKYFKCIFLTQTGNNISANRLNKITKLFLNDLHCKTKCHQRTVYDHASLNVTSCGFNECITRELCSCHSVVSCLLEKNETSFNGTVKNVIWMIIFRHVRMNGCAVGADCILYGMFSVKKVRLTFNSLSWFCVTASCKAMLTFRGITVHRFIVNLTLFTELLLRVFFLHSKEEFQSCDQRKNTLRTRIGRDVFQLKHDFWNDDYPPLKYITEDMEKKCMLGKVLQEFKKLHHECLSLYDVCICVL